jgi:hypothetical protein
LTVRVAAAGREFEDEGEGPFHELCEDDLDALFPW